ncbi:WIYLD domain-containing protein [Cephalotus follicularis]|uniref:WIYLD domain-containing protein n=1 Tax=Cephalotus follicularis TaxID=3775 RepID=A0A1Q3AM99_CEPFO|nr:WIYLD domain-containing protein [Cephalotus follicularis]
MLLLNTLSIGKVLVHHCIGKYPRFLLYKSLLQRLFATEKVKTCNPRTLTMLPARRNVGLKRIDAALDALRPMGFPNALVRKTVRTLLKAYGGDSGWPFIEEASYQLVIDTILEELEKSEPNDIEFCSNKKDNSIQDAETAARPSKSAIVPTFSDAEGMDIEAQINEINEVPVSASIMNEALSTTLQTTEFDGKYLLPRADGEGSGWKDIELETHSRGKQKTEAILQVNSCGASPVDITNPPHVFRLPQPVKSHQPQTRRPFYGWICSDDEEDLVELPPAPLSVELAKIYYGTDIQRKWKSRWDVRPEDM